jgi:protein required for attachment to host cells
MIAETDPPKILDKLYSTFSCSNISCRIIVVNFNGIISRWAEYNNIDKEYRPMANYCVVVTSGAHARFFTLKTSAAPVLESGPKLIERGELSNPEKEIPGRDLYAAPKSGRSRAPHGGPAHGYDDHRSQHEDECDRRFASEVLKKANGVAKAEKARHVILIAPARMLGCLRQDLDIIRRQGIRIQELAKDISKLNSTEIHDYVAKEGLLPARKRTPI